MYFFQEEGYKYSKKNTGTELDPNNQQSKKQLQIIKNVVQKVSTNDIQIQLTIVIVSL